VSPRAPVCRPTPLPLEDRTLSARHKLNAAWLRWAGLLAGLAGLVTQSWPVFFVVLALLVAAALAAGDIRP
jgi:hypothetical protein